LLNFFRAEIAETRHHNTDACLMSMLCLLNALAEGLATKI